MQTTTVPNQSLFLTKVGGKIASILLNPLRAAHLFSSYIQSLSFFAATDRFSAQKLTYRDVPFFCRRHDWVAVDEVLLHEEYKFALAAIQNISAPLCLDLGANIGAFAIYCFSEFPNAQIISVEPARDTFDILSRTKLENAKLNWRCVHAAISAEPGTLYLNRGGASSAHFVDAQGDGESVTALSMSQLIASINTSTEIDLVKMDIEGSEGPVLLGDSSFLQRVRNIVIEMHPEKVDQAKLESVLRTYFSRICRAPNLRKSSKPLLLCSR
jgi:FkbM family methyltransferase